MKTQAIGLQQFADIFNELTDCRPIGDGVASAYRGNHPDYGDTIIIQLGTGETAALVYDPARVPADILTFRSTSRTGTPALT